MGRQGWLIIVFIILVTAVFAATRSDWPSMLVAALVPPLIMFPLIFVLTRRWQDGARVRDRRVGPREDFELLTFLARTNPIMFLVFGALSGRSQDDRFQQLYRAGPYGMGRTGYLFALLIILAPLALALIITAVTGQLPAHSGPHFS
jgi:hypothetical protein